MLALKRVNGGELCLCDETVQNVRIIKRGGILERVANMAPTKESPAPVTFTILSSGS